MSWRPHFEPDERFLVTRAHHARRINAAMLREQVRLHRYEITF